MTHPTPAPAVRFLVVPFLPAHQPALGVSSLVGVLQREGIAAECRYLNLGYGERLGWDLYGYLTNLLPTSFLPGELVFSRALWGERAAPFAPYAEKVTRWIESAATGGDAGRSGMLEQWSARQEGLRAAIEEAPAVVSAWADEVLAGAPRVLGFTSTFQQSSAALALAQEVRRRVGPDEVAILFGGANCEDDMGRALSESFPFIDCVVSGEAEEVIVGIVRPLVDGDGAAPPRFVQGAMVRNLDALPLPAFDDYFAAAARTSFGEATWLAAESSRGCWWGAKSHCTFCGLNGGTMAFRSKSPERFAEELDTLSQRYGSSRFSLTDNILDMGYLRTFLPALVAQARPYRLFYETKSNLRKDQVELLAAAGVASLQPGIESFSTAVLKLMGKGTTRLQNLQLLKWCAELGIQVAWNILYGFPGEDPAEYAAMEELLPSLVHLPAPMSCSRVRFDRFGPYWKWPERYGIRNLRHHWSYDFVFAGVPEQQRDRLAYFFEHDGGDVDPRSYGRPVAELATRWREPGGAPPRLELRRGEGGRSVLDTRPCRRDEHTPLDAGGAALLRALDGYRSRASAARAVAEAGMALSDRDCDRLLQDFLARRFVIEEGGCFLSLVVDPRERLRVAERQVALRADRLGLRWPQDFPDPTHRRIVRAAMLGMGSGAAGSGAPAPPPGS
jgi:ribosomal peptide maturation radical SAM protein 1